MNVPRHIRANGSDDNFVPAVFGGGTLANGGDCHKARDSMVVPDRIVVAGGDELVPIKPTPREIALDMHTFGPGRYVSNSLLETPPEKLTLVNHAYPTVDEVEMLRQQFRTQSNSEDRPPSENTQKEDDTRKDISEKVINISSDSLPPSSTMSLLTPSEELILLRNQVRKMTTRLQKLEEELQDTNRHVNWIEVLGGLGVVTALLCALGAMRRL